VEECWSCFHCVDHAVLAGAEEQKRTDACLIARWARNLRQLDYLCAHCSIMVADRADMTPSTRVRSHIVLTKMIVMVGEGEE